MLAHPPESGEKSWQPPDFGLLQAKTEEEVPEAGTNGVQLLQEGELAADAAMTQVTQVCAQER